MKTTNINPQPIDSHLHTNNINILDFIKDVFIKKANQHPFKDNITWEVSRDFPSHRIDRMFHKDYASHPIELKIYCDVSDEERVKVERLILLGYRVENELGVIPIYIESMLAEIDLHVRTRNKPINDKFIEYIDPHFNVHVSDAVVQLGTWTDGGVNMFIDLSKLEHKNFFEQFKERIAEFDIDEEIDLHREGEKYKTHFTITESVKDFTGFKNRLESILEEMEENE